MNVASSISLKDWVDFEELDLKVALSAEASVLDIGSDIFQSEDIIDKAYEVFLKLMDPKEFESGLRSNVDKGGIGDFAIAYTGGLYWCAVRRSIILHQYDPRNDVVPSELSVWLGGGCAEVMHEIPKMPREWRSAARGRHFRSSSLILDKGRARFNPWVVTLTEDGRILPAQPMAGSNFTEYTWNTQGVTLFSSIAVNLWCDRKYLWQVNTSSETLGSIETPLTMGVSPDHIKSLFYARTLPVTESGRRRPILHWVRAHQRRLKDGIDIDIEKHLRGIEEFSMGGFDWSIINPRKAGETNG